MDGIYGIEGCRNPDEAVYTYQVEVEAPAKNTDKMGDGQHGEGSKKEE